MRAGDLALNLRLAQNQRVEAASDLAQMSNGGFPHADLQVSTKGCLRRAGHTRQVVAQVPLPLISAFDDGIGFQAIASGKDRAFQSIARATAIVWAQAAQGVGDGLLRQGKLFPDLYRGGLLAQANL